MTMIKTEMEFTKKVQEIIKFAESPKHAEDSESQGYLSDGEVLDIVIDKIKQAHADLRKESLDVRFLKGWATTEQLLTELERRGYYTQNMWQTTDVTSSFECTKGQALMVLDRVLDNDWLLEQIWIAIRSEAKDAGFKEKES